MSDEPPARSVHSPSLALTCMAALGVVYGDIGTSPLYALRECFHGPHAVAATQANILGVLSLIFWSLTIVISVKYLSYVLRIDNDGEGGILALMALVERHAGGTRRRWLVGMFGLFGAALLYGDGMLTPAISVLSAVEGLEVATPVFKPYIVPITVTILTGLFLFQKRGTSGVGRVFGPVVMVWFATLGVLGIKNILMHPTVFAALSPHHAARFFLDNGMPGFIVLGSVFLVVTGGEALYVDLGHFSAKPIRITWFSLVGPALLLNYFGQGALLLENPAAAHNPFYRMVPAWGTIPLVLLATAATVIASQAVISGVFSLTRQAVQLGYAPRVTIRHTSSYRIGEIYVPAANWGLWLATSALVIGFGSSSGLAAAYGVAVSLDMVITTFLAYLAARHILKWRPAVAAGVTVALLVVDFAFLGANMTKVADGGWIPLTVAAIAVIIFTTWKAGQRALFESEIEARLPVSIFVNDPGLGRLARVPGDAVFLSPDREGIPTSLLHNVKHNQVLHKRNVLLTVVTEGSPFVQDSRRLDVQQLSDSFYRATARYGFKEDPDIPALFRQAKSKGLDLNPMTTTFFLSRNTLLTTAARRIARWRAELYGFFYRNELRPALFYKLPPNRIVEIGRQVQL